MPSVKKDTTPADGGMEVVTRVASEEMTMAGTAGNPVPKQQAAHVEHECG
ncbi:hypothetical protein BCO18430_03356 [Burkholderia contaminans]|nr:hypothetical protein [Burkholderia contaminans]VWC92708.1 hypothetical protein BCO18430_03356 [Burkholderia contaminans]